MERGREFRQGILAAYIDLKKAFDSVHREAFWDLRLRGIPAGNIELLSGLYSGTKYCEVCVREGGGRVQLLSFSVHTGVRQGCVLAPSLFNACIDWVLGRRAKIRIFKSVVIPVLRHGCETWTLNTDLKRQMYVFVNKCLCSGVSLE